LKPKAYYELINLNEVATQPPAVIHLSDGDIEHIRDNPLHLKQPCHNQAVERHVELVTEAASSVVAEAASSVVGFGRRKGLIRQKIRSQN